MNKKKKHNLFPFFFFFFFTTLLSCIFFPCAQWHSIFQTVSNRRRLFCCVTGSVVDKKNLCRFPRHSLHIYRQPDAGHIQAHYGRHTSRRVQPQGGPQLDKTEPWRERFERGHLLWRRRQYISPRFVQRDTHHEEDFNVPRRPDRRVWC